MHEMELKNKAHFPAFVPDWKFSWRPNVINRLNIEFWEKMLAGLYDNLLTYSNDRGNPTIGQLS